MPKGMPVRVTDWFPDCDFGVWLLSRRTIIISNYAQYFQMAFLGNILREGGGVFNERIKNERQADPE